MIIFKHARDLRNYLQKGPFPAESVGLVPTMGALHEGHISLIEESRRSSKVTVCSIFVNPTQFNNPEDFAKYPKTLENDILLLESHCCEVLFLPDEMEIYPDQQSKEKHFDLGMIETLLEGKFRPGHFQGVCQVMERLLNIVQPGLLFMGQKDFQQCIVVSRLIRLMGKNIQLVPCKILREDSGLAMSSRNLRLSAPDRLLASELHRTLVSIRDQMENFRFLQLQQQATTYLEEKGFKVEYLELARKDTLLPPSPSDKSDGNILLVAAFLGEVRLIDNLLIIE